MFKFSSIVILGIAVAFGTPSLARAASVSIDGRPVSGVVAKDGHLMVPFRAPLQSIGATVSWDDASNVASAAYKGAQLVTVTIGSTDATVTGNQKQLSIAPVLENHLAYIPVEALGDISHATVAYSSDRQNATVTNWDLAGVTDVGGGNISIWLWVWILVVGGFAYLIAAAAVSRMNLRRS